MPGGNNNTAAGAWSLAAGRRAKANHEGSFVWADATDADFASTNNHQFAVRAQGGVRLETGGAGLTVAGPVTVGNTTSASPPAGTIRWTGCDFEGFTGSRWGSLTGRTNTITPIANMVQIAPGTFFMGSPDTGSGPRIR